MTRRLIALLTGLAVVYVPTVSAATIPAGRALTVPLHRYGGTGAPTLDAPLALQLKHRVWQPFYWACIFTYPTPSLEAVYCYGVPAGWRVVPYGVKALPARS